MRVRCVTTTTTATTATTTTTTTTTTTKEENEFFGASSTTRSKLEKRVAIRRFLGRQGGGRGGVERVVEWVGGWMQEGHPLRSGLLNRMRWLIDNDRAASSIMARPLQRLGLSSSLFFHSLISFFVFFFQACDSSPLRTAANGGAAAELLLLLLLLQSGTVCK